MKDAQLFNTNDSGEDEDDSKIFPQRLIAILSDELNQEAICWLPHGKSFIVRNRQLFSDTVMPRYFSRKAKYSSFTRKLNRWNFTRVSSGPELGAYHHEFFLRDSPNLVAQMFCKNARTMLAMSGCNANTTANTNSNVAVPTSPVTDSTSKIDSPKARSVKQEKKMAVRTKDAYPTVQGPVMSQPLSLLSEQRRAPMPQKPALSSVCMKPSSMVSLYPQEMLNKSSGTKDQLMESLSPAAFASANGYQLLERQMQLMMQQEQQNRLYMAMQMGQQQQQRSIGGNGMNVASPNDLRLLQLRQMMERNQRLQQQRRQPANGRASAA